MKVLYQPYPARHHQSGTAVIEFVLISIFFFTLLFGVIELGRIMYVWNTVQEVTRRAAREAVVRNFVTDTEAVLRDAIFRSGSIGQVYLPGSPEITNAQIRITYLYAIPDAANPNPTVSPVPTDPDDNLSACADAGRSNSCIRYVRAEVCDAGNCAGVLYQPMIGFLLAVGGVDFRVQIPISPVVMPAESLGFVPSS